RGRGGRGRAPVRPDARRGRRRGRPPPDRRRRWASVRPV
ncbi:MAG: hypothetical protein AVDCRST_MAG19-1853, partial [uncultured Thermomicrobiales bacterium]